jgi:hypothetical protein
MILDSDDSLRALLRRGLDPLAPDPGFELRVRLRLRDRAGGRRHRPAARLLSVAASLVLVAALGAGFILLRGTGTPSLTSTSVLGALEAGPSAAPVAGGTGSFVWLEEQLEAYETGGGSVCYGSTRSPGSSSSPAPTDCQSMGPVVMERVQEEIAVLDWTGTVRYRFSLPELTLDGRGVPDWIVSISPDGTRAALADGRVIDQSGRTIATVLPLAATSALGSPGAVAVTWESDDSGLCITGPTEVLDAPSSWASGYRLAGSYTSLALDVLPLNGQLRRVATLDVGPSPISISDPNAILACDPSSDSALLLNFSDSDESLRAVRLSTGGVLYRQQPPVPASGGDTYALSSLSGSLAAELGAGSSAARRTAGCDSDAVLHIPSGEPVPGIAALTCPSGLAISADGTRILATNTDFTGTSVWAPGTRTTLELIAASTGADVRSVTLPGNVSVSAVASPSGAHFMLKVSGHLVLVDGSGGVSGLQARGIKIGDGVSGFAFASDGGASS